MEQVTEFPGSAPTRRSAANDVIERYARLPALIEPGTVAGPESLHRLAELLSTFGETTTVNLHFAGVTGTQRWNVKVDPKGAAAKEGAAAGPGLELIMRPETWTEIATGSLSPLLALGSGRMRIRGDLELGKRLLRHLATSSDAIVQIC